MKEKLGPPRESGETDDEPEFRVEDRRHWVHGDVADGADDSVAAPARPSLLEEYRQKAEAAELKLREYIEAFKSHQDEQEAFRLRLERDVDRRVQLKFGELVAALLESADHLDLALGHAAELEGADQLIQGLELARKGFELALEHHGVERIEPDGEEFDPELAEAMRLEPVDSPERDGKVIATLRPGYKLGDHVIRPARVAVGRHTASG